MNSSYNIPPFARAPGIDWAQRMVIATLILFASNVLFLIPFRIGPVTPTMLVELGVVVLLIGPLTIGLQTLDRRAKMFIFVCLCMFALSFINLDGNRLVVRIKYIFVSVYVYVLITCILRGPVAMQWVRRVHLIPAYSMLVTFIYTLATQGLPDLSKSVGGNGLPMYYASLLPICWTQFRNEFGGWRFLNGMLIPAAFVVEVLSGSRGGAICLLLASLLVLLTGKKSELRWLPLVIAVSLLTGVSVYKEAVITQRVTGMIMSPKESIQERLRLWKAAIIFTCDHPFWGGDFRENAGEYVSKVTWGSDDESMRIQRGDLSSAAGEHNGYLATTAGFGVILAAFYFAYFLGLGRRIRHAVRTLPDGRTRSYLSAGFCALLVWAVGMISSHIFLGWDYLLIWGALECTLGSKVESRNYESRFLRTVRQ